MAFTYIVSIDGKTIFRNSGDGDRIFHVNTLMYSFGARTSGITCQGCGRYIPAKELYGVRNETQYSHCMKCVDYSSRQH